MPLLTHSHKEAPTGLTVDASDEAVHGGLFCSSTSRYTDNGYHWPFSVNSCVLQKESRALFTRSFWPFTYRDVAFQIFPGRKGVHSIH